MIKREPRGSARMYYSHVKWLVLHVFDVNTEIFNLGVVRQFDHIAETRFCAPADGEIFPECNSALRSRLKLLATCHDEPLREPETVCAYTSTGGFFFSTYRSRSTEVTSHGRARRSPARSQSRAKSACAGASTAYQSLPRANAPLRVRSNPIDRPLTSQPRPIAFFHPSQWLPDPEPPRT